MSDDIDFSRIEEHDVKIKQVDAVVADLFNSEGAPTSDTIESLTSAQRSVESMNWIKVLNVKATDDKLKDLIAKHVPNNKYLNDSKKIIPPTSERALRTVSLEITVYYGTMQ